MPWKKGAWYRCTHCWTRRTLSKPVEEYVTPPKCRCCGRKLKYRDKYREKAELTTPPCNCGDPVYPHRPGSSVWCASHPTGPTEQDHNERWGYA